MQCESSLITRNMTVAVKLKPVVELQQNKNSGKHPRHYLLSQLPHVRQYESNLRMLSCKNTTGQQIQSVGDGCVCVIKTLEITETERLNSLHTSNTFPCFKFLKIKSRTSKPRPNTSCEPSTHVKQVCLCTLLHFLN